MVEEIEEGKAILRAVLAHTHTGNCSRGPESDSDFCHIHPKQFRGQCSRCEPCVACDLEWARAATGDRPVVGR